MMKQEIDDTELIQPGDGRSITYQGIRDAIQSDNDGRHYHMTIRCKTEWKAIAEAVNQGIDSRLQACNSPDRGDIYDAETGECEISPESLPVFLRRLLEDSSEEFYEEAMSLADAILMTLGFNDYGKHVGREEVGL